MIQVSLLLLFLGILMCVVYGFYGWAQIGSGCLTNLASTPVNDILIKDNAYSLVAIFLYEASLLYLPPRWRPILGGKQLRIS